MSMSTNKVASKPKNSLIAPSNNQAHKRYSFHQNVLQLIISTPRSMKFVLVAIISFQFMNFGKAQVTITPPIPLYCNCFNSWIDNTLDFLGLPDSTKPKKLAKKIMKKLDNNIDELPLENNNDGCLDIIPEFKYMFGVIQYSLATKNRLS